MKRNFYLMICIAFSFALGLNSCKKDKPSEDLEPIGDGMIQKAVKDYDGNTYNAVKIGNQVWMASNLKTTHYADGTAITLGNMLTDVSSHTPFRYYPDNNSSLVNKNGYLYNWSAVVKGTTGSSASPSGIQGICPTGWHVPSAAEWTELTTYLGSKSEFYCGNNSNYIAKALATTSGWNQCSYANTVGNNQSANNASGFAAMPAGESHQTPQYYGDNAFFWTSTPANSSPNVLMASFRSLCYYEAFVTADNEFKELGMSVRCVRDK